MKHVLAAFCVMMYATSAFAVAESDFNALFGSPPRASLTVSATEAAAHMPVELLTEAAPDTAVQPAKEVAPEQVEVVKTVPRNAFEISYDDVEKAVSLALAQKGVADKVGAKINGRKNAPIFSFGQPVSVHPRTLQFDQRTGRWSANLYFAIENGDVVTVLPAAGHFSEILEVPVLKRQVRNGDIIRDIDIELRDFALNQTRNDTVTDISSLIGKTPLRTISPYRPIRSAEVANPSIVKKDAIVQMQYNIPGMQISASGQALAAGAKGDVIDVRNVGSRKTVRAVIVSANTVSVSAVQQQTSQLNSDEESHAY
jgi:flagellar basal body P-ring formation protein FlgA